MTQTSSALEQNVGRLSELTRRYARFSVSAAGLGGVLGGALVLVTYFVGALVPDLSAPARLALASAPLVWIVAKELLRSRYYQRLGRVEEARSRADRLWHLALTAVTLVISAAIVAPVLVKAWPDVWDLGTLGYLGFVAALPLLVWFFMRTPLEYIAGVFLVVQAAVVLAGGNYQLWQQPQAPIGGAVLLVLGVRQHLEFLRIDRELERLRAELA